MAALRLQFVGAVVAMAFELRRSSMVRIIRRSLCAAKTDGIEKPVGRKHFIREIVDTDLQRGVVKQLVTRFPPEPNGYLHVGHAKAICLNFGMARDYDGRVHMRFDDTNPEKEDEEYEHAILEDVQWLVGEGVPPWDGEVRRASDYFEEMYDFALGLIANGEAYVDSQSAAEMRANRGTLTQAGFDSPYRNRSVEENRLLFEAMRSGDMEEGEAVLRAKIDMASPNLNMRDPTLYRIKKVAHARTGTKWIVYPMYDMAHALSDAIEGITHSLCTLEFQDHRPLYDWVVERWLQQRPQDGARNRPRQYEFSRLNLQYTVTSKRKLMRIVETGKVDGWDDPRMPTIAGMRRRGVPAAAIRLFCERVGISKADSQIDPILMDDCTRSVFDQADVPRIFCVLDPLPVHLVNFDEIDTVRAPFRPSDDHEERELSFGGRVCIDRSDFWDVETQGPSPAGFNRLIAGGRVRLRYAYVVRCENVVRDDKGSPLRLECSVERDTRQGATGANGKVKGIIHWLPANALRVPVNVYDRLFAVELPEGDDEDLNPNSLVVHPEALIERVDDDDDLVQFERLGYFRRDPITQTYNRVVPLRSSWSPPPPQAPAPLSPELEVASLIEISVGLVRSCREHPDSDTLWCLEVDCGEDEPRPIAASLRQHYTDLTNRRIVFVKNTKPRKIAGFVSHGFVLCAVSDDATILLEPPPGAAPGDRLTFKGLNHVQAAPPSQVKNKKLWEKAQPAFVVEDEIIKVSGRPLQAQPSPAEDNEDEDGVVRAPGAPNGAIVT